MIKITFWIFATLFAVTAAEKDMDYVHCCEYKDLVDHAIVTKCHQPAASNDKKDQFKAHSCHLNCIARDMNLTDGGNFVVSKYNHMVETLAHKAEADFYKKQIMECEAKINDMEKHHKEHKHHDNDDPNCPKKIYFIMMCLAKKIALECPADKKIQTAACEAIRQSYEKIGQKFENH